MTKLFKEKKTIEEISQMDWDELIYETDNELRKNKFYIFLIILTIISASFLVIFSISWLLKFLNII